MAFLREYGAINYETLFDAQTYATEVDTLLGLQQFQIVEDVIDPLSLTIIGLEKSLFSKKQKGWVQLSFIQDATADLSKYTDYDEPLPIGSDLLLGFEFWSVYNSSRGASGVYYALGQPRKLVLNYGVLLYYIQNKIEVIDTFILEKLMAFSENMVDNLLSGISSFDSTGKSEKMSSDLKALLERLKPLENLKKYSRLPVTQ